MCLEFDACQMCGFSSRQNNCMLSISEFGHLCAYIWLEAHKCSRGGTVAVPSFRLFQVCSFSSTFILNPPKVSEAYFRVKLLKGSVTLEHRVFVGHTVLLNL